MGTAIYKRDKRLAAERAKEAESAVAEKNDGELSAIDAKMLEPYFNAKYKGIGSSYRKIGIIREIANFNPINCNLPLAVLQFMQQED